MCTSTYSFNSERMTFMYSVLFILTYWHITTSKTILDIAEDLGATEFLRYANRTGFSSNITTKGPFTLFLPNNDAFHNLPDNINSSMDYDDYVTTLLQYHVIHGRHEKQDFQNEAMFKTLRPQIESNGHMKLRMNIYQNGTVYTSSGSPIVSFDHVASNGIVHVLSRVMYMMPEMGTVATLTVLPICRYVRYGLIDGGLAKLMSGSGPFTLFAPTDIAFQNLPNKTQNIMYQNRTAIRRVMENHIVKGTYFTEGMFEGQQFTTLFGDTIGGVHFEKGNITIEGSLLILNDFMGTNGVLHFTSKVWVPPGIV